MASTSIWAPTSRTSTPNGPSPYPKPMISLEDWEAKAPLSESELRSIGVIQNALNNKSLPLKESYAEASSSRAGSPNPLSAGIVKDTFRRSETPVSIAEKAIHGKKKLLPDRPVQTAQEFYDWFSMVEHLVAHNQESHYRDHLAMVQTYLNTCEDLTRSVDLVHNDTDEMLDAWRAVELGGRSLKGACEQLLDERDRLIRMAEDIEARLEYFQELEHATRMLNHPGDSLVLQPDFLNVVERIDICIEYLRARRHYRESEIYLLRYQQCLTRAMTLIKMYFVGSLKALTSDILRRIPDKEISSTAHQHLLYTRFQSVAVQVAPLIGELERRSRSHPDDLSALLAECHSAYLGARKSLLSGRLTEEIKGLDPTRSDLVDLTRAGCSYLKQLCVDEFSLYRCFFNSGKDMLYAYLESLCDYLYDDLRPRILHEARLSVLCSVCKVLRALMVLDVPEVDSSSDEEGDCEQYGLLEHKHDEGLGKLHIGHMLQSVLQDAQTRLLFKAQNVIQSEIRYYVPKSEDLDYMKLLQEAKRLHRPNVSVQEKVSPFSRISYHTERDTWYAPLRTMIAVLEQLHEFVQLSILDDIAEEAIHYCRINLLTAASVIATTTSSPGELDAQLFLIRHLLVLKEIIAALNLGNRDSTYDFKHVAETLRDMLRTSNFITYAFSSSFSRPRDEITNGSIKEYVDADLKRACEVVIQLCIRLVTQPIHDFMLSLDGRSAISTGENSAGQNDEKTPATRRAAIDTESTFRATLESKLPGFIEKLKLYLGGGGHDMMSDVSNGLSEGSRAGTVTLLLDHVQERIIDVYVTFRRAAEFLPADDGSSAPLTNEAVKKDGQTFVSPEDVRALVKALC